MNTATETPSANPGEVFAITLQVPDSAIDLLGHTNNVEYLRWLEQAAWAHTEALRLGWPEYEKLGVACMVRRHTIDYLGQTRAGDQLRVETWVAENSGKAKMVRGYRIVNEAAAKTVLRAESLWACVRLSDGRPVRMPPEFLAAYQVAVPPA